MAQSTKASNYGTGCPVSLTDHAWRVSFTTRHPQSWAPGPRRQGSYCHPHTPSERGRAGGRAAAVAEVGLCLRPGSPCSRGDQVQPQEPVAPLDSAPLCRDLGLGSGNRLGSCRAFFLCSLQCQGTDPRPSGYPQGGGGGLALGLDHPWALRCLTGLIHCHDPLRRTVLGTQVGSR